jgi:hypothetical protein
MRKMMIATLLSGSCLLLSGCFDVEQSLVLQKDLSGKAGFTMTVDMEPMATMMAHMKHAMAGGEGEPSAQEIADVKKEMLASKKSETKMKPEAEKEKLEKELPPGVKLLDSSIKEEGLKTTVNLLFGFDNVSKLGMIHLPEKEGAEAGSPTANPFDQPFADLQLKDEGKTYLLTSRTINPAAEKAEAPEMSPEEEKQVEQMFKGLRLAYKIEIPFEVVESNATRRDGRTLYWEYDLKTLSKMKPEELKEGVRVRFKK